MCFIRHQICMAAVIISSAFYFFFNIPPYNAGFEDLGDAWRQREFFDTPELVQIVEDLWQELRPMYVQLHSYVRRKLETYYAKNHPDFDFPKDGSIPAHLLGNFLQIIII